MTDQRNRAEEARDPAMISLQEALDQMSAEVPDMPESFRRGWREALRAEQAAAKQNDARTGEEQRQSAASGSKGRSLSWRRALSIAAVAAFVLGGTLLGQDAVHFEKERADLKIPAAVSTELPQLSLSANGSASVEGPIRDKTAEITQAIEAERREAPTGPMDADLSADLLQPMSMSPTEADSGAAEEAAESDSAEIREEAGTAAVPSEEAEKADDAGSAEEEAAGAADMGSTEEETAETAAAGSAGEEAAGAADTGSAEEEDAEPAGETGTEEETAGAENRDGGARPLRTAGTALILIALALAAVLLAKKREKDNTPS